MRGFKRQTSAAAEPTETTVPRPRSTASLKNLSTQLHKDPVIAGYLHNVRTSKQSAKGSEYFSFTIQEKVKKIEAFCFSPKKHKGNVVSRVESGLPCKLTTFSFHKTEDNVNWVNTATQINDALEATADFCREANDNKTTMANTKDVDNIQVYQGITVHGMVLFGDN